jgi:hypothetical protein
MTGAQLDEFIGRINSKVDRRNLVVQNAFVAAFLTVVVAPLVVGAHLLYQSFCIIYQIVYAENKLIMEVFKVNLNAHTNSQLPNTTRRFVFVFIFRQKHYISDLWKPNSMAKRHLRFYTVAHKMSFGFWMKIEF